MTEKDFLKYTHYGVYMVIGNSEDRPMGAKFQPSKNEKDEDKKENGKN